MATEVNRRALLVILLTTGLLLGASWSVFHRASAHRRLTLSQEDLAACRTAAERIVAVRQQKQRALLQTKPSDELNRKIDGWARDVGIDAKLLARIDPQEPRRVGDTQYLEQVTELELFGVTLHQLIGLAQLAEQAEDGLHLTSLRLSPPRTADTDGEELETWNAEMALTYLIYSPKSTRP